MSKPEGNISLSHEVKLKTPTAAKEVVKRVKKAIIHAKVSVGYKGNYRKRKNRPYHMVAGFHEKGTLEMEARPFFSLARYRFVKETKAEIFNNRDPDNVGRTAVFMVRSSINSLTRPSLMFSTIRRKKGFTKPLIRTGQLFNKVTYIVTESKPGPGGIKFLEMINRAFFWYTESGYFTGGKVMANPGSTRYGTKTVVIGPSGTLSVRGGRRVK